MKKSLFLLILICSICMSPKVIAKEEINVGAESAILMEKESKRILFQKNIDTPQLTASIAKIMTAIVAIENGDLNGYCLVDQDTINQVGSAIYMELGDKLKLKDLLYGLMLRSGNDAAYLIAKTVGGNVDQFVKMMNIKAKEIKMTSSVFNNPSGLDENTFNYSTALDMALLMAYCMDNDIFRKITDAKSYRCESMKGNIYVFTNKHRLVQSYNNCNGGKTGYTKLARRTLVSSFKKDGLELIVVTLKSGNGDFNDHINLSEYGFNNFQNVKVFNRGILDIPEYSITPIIYQDVTYPVKTDEVLKCEIHLVKKTKEYCIGRIYLKINDQVVKTINVYRYY